MLNYIKELNEKGIVLEKNGDKLKVHLLTKDVDESLLEEIRNKKEQLLDFLSKNLNEYKKIPRADVQESYSLSSMQYNLWVHSQNPETSLAYNMSFSIEMKEVDDISLVIEAINALVDRHQILRTIFKANKEGEIRQYILEREQLGFEVNTLDVRNSSDEEIINFIQKNSELPFELDKGPLIRAYLLKKSSKTYLLIFNIHHIIFDAISVNVLHKDFNDYYSSLVQGQEPNLSPLEIQYKDFSVWYNGNHKKETSEQVLSKYSAIDDYASELPLSKPRKRNKKYVGKSITKEIKNDIFANIVSLSKENNTTLYNTLLSFLKILIFKYTGSIKVCVGSDISVRNHVMLENQIGYYVDTIVLNTLIDKYATFQNFFNDFKKEIAFYVEEKSSFYPLKIVENRYINEVFENRNLFFDILFTFLSDRDSSADEGRKPLDEGTTLRFDMEVFFQQIGNRLLLTIAYDDDLYESKFIKEFMENYESIAEKILENPDKKLKEIQLIDAPDIHSHNQAAISNVSFIDYFIKAVEENPDRVAIILNDDRLTYAELYSKAASVASFISKGGYKKIVLFMDRGFEYIISMIGVLMAHSYFVPMDPKQNKKNAGYLIDSEADLIITTDQNIESLEKLTDLSLVCNYKDIPDNSYEYLAVDMKSPAYIMHTSGSTGKAKAAIVTHEGMTNHLIAKVNDFNIQKATIIAQNATQTFDVSIWQFLAVLIKGGEAVIFPDEICWDNKELFYYLEKYNITLLESVPTHLGMMLNHVENNIDKINLDSLECFIMNGEKFPSKYAERWFNVFPDIKMANVYGPTECSDDVTHFMFEKYDNGWGDSVPIGKAIQNVNLYILDGDLNILPPGCEGELFVSGICVGKGYFNNPEQTADRFIDNPFKIFDGFDILYKTGDIVKLVDENYVYLGRSDNQVKINGQRIELGEIESILLKTEEITHAKIIYKDINNIKTLIAYYCSANEIPKSELIRKLSKELPYILIPTYFIYLEEFPMLENGKVNTDKFPVPIIEHNKGVIENSKLTALEKELLEIFQHILQIDTMKITDNFLELGMNSIHFLNAMGIIKRKYNHNIDLEALFINPSVESLSKIISKKKTMTI